MIEWLLTMDMSIHQAGEDGSMTEVNRVLAFVGGDVLKSISLDREYQSRVVGYSDEAIGNQLLRLGVEEFPSVDARGLHS